MNKTLSPICEPFDGANNISNIVIRNINLIREESPETYEIFIQGKDYAYAKVIFRKALGMRILNERELLEFWENYGQDISWLLEVKSGGWMDLEKTRDSFNSFIDWELCREYMIVEDLCISILSFEKPEIIDLGRGNLGNENK